MALEGSSLTAKVASVQVSTWMLVVLIQPVPCQLSQMGVPICAVVASPACGRMVTK